MRDVIVDEEWEAHDVEWSIYSFELEYAEITELVVVVRWHDRQPLTAEKEINRSVFLALGSNDSLLCLVIRNLMGCKELFQKIGEVKIRDVD